ncbi:MAG TPA: histidine--tRNA ligase [Bacteroidia bacterium]|nr:histidine--tRNA ligase [Bacteroidia bacterium]
MKPSIPKGTRDFSPSEMVRRNFIFSSIREVFERYGYQPIETPAMENIETLTGKYGDEGDQLLFKILNSRQFEAKNKEELKKEYERSLTQNINSPLLTERALRYDLTVPFARYVVQHQNEIVFPFKRYQIQPVWRADRPQKGRYREFFQCDADVVGSDSLLNEVELIQIINDVYAKLGISVTIKMNNRKILSALAELIGEKDKIVDITVAIDKLDKVGLEGVNKELSEKGISNAAIEKLQPLILFQGASSDKINLLKQVIGRIEIGKKGIEEVEYVFSGISADKSLKSTFELDITLARGLNYYTGAIFEVKANHVQIGSICGGGRYDNLTGIFGLPNVSGVGISFGIDRIFDVMNELNLFDGKGIAAQTTKILLTHFGEQERNYCISVASRLREAGINTEIYPDVTKKIAKQFDYANKKQIPFVIVVGTEEMNTGVLAFKDMATGEQKKIKLEEIVNLF